jgi:flagellar protein FliS
MNARAANAYRRVDLESAPKHDVLGRLFERFITDLEAAKIAIGNRDIATKAASLDHAHRILTELEAALDHAAAPELCANLLSLYRFVGERINSANVKLDAKPLDESIRVIREIATAFQGAR